MLVFSLFFPSVFGLFFGGFLRAVVCFCVAVSCSLVGVVLLFVCCPVCGGVRVFVAGLFCGSCSSYFGFVVP